MVKVRILWCENLPLITLLAVVLTKMLDTLLLQGIFTNTSEL
jgi:hypothetical protein